MMPHRPDSQAQLPLALIAPLLELQQSAPEQIWVLALSGGLDSVALLRTLVHLQIPCCAVHVNHQLQKQAVHWQDFCQSECHSLGVPFHTLVVNVDPSSGEGLEAAARSARYHALGLWMKDNQFQHLITAHHQDDQLETVLLQLFRGSGLRGVGGMSSRAAWPVLRQQFSTLRVFRPWLGVPRTELERVVTSQAWPHIEDPSNTDQTIRRNWVRHSLLPELAIQFPQARSGVLKLAEFMQRHHAELDESVRPHVEALLNGDALQLTPWRLCDPALQLEVLKTWLQRHHVRCGADGLLELARQLNQVTSGGVRHVRKGWAVQVAQHQARVLNPYHP